jgi:hypothetical protein
MASDSRTIICIVDCSSEVCLPKLKTAMKKILQKSVYFLFCFYTSNYEKFSLPLKLFSMYVLFVGSHFFLTRHFAAYFPISSKHLPQKTTPLISLPGLDSK